MTNSRILCVFKQFRCLSWAARQIGVNKGTLSRYLNGQRPSAIVEGQRPRVEQLADLVTETKGACKREVNGSSVRSQIAKIRRRKTK